MTRWSPPDASLPPLRLPTGSALRHSNAATKRGPMNHEILSPRPAAHGTRPNVRLAVLSGLTALSWLIAYNLIQPLANWLMYALLGLPAGSHLGESVAFFLYDVPKILL